MSLTPPPLLSKRIIKRINPLQLGKILALIYGLGCLIFAPLILIIVTLAPHPRAQQGLGFAAIGTGFALLFPFLYAAFGFITGVIGSVIYNLIAKWVGGIEVDVE